jgi:oxygen-independent coproporphyrinogen-3 oxidase
MKIILQLQKSHIIDLHTQVIWSVVTNLFEKYNRPGPRYTSYPPVPFWNNAPSEVEWISHLKSQYNKTEGIDLYVHIPYCEQLCYYCGCNRVITQNHNVEDSFVNLLLNEWQTYCDKLGMVPEVNSLHFGGGTPTFLSADNLEKIIIKLTAKKTSNFTGSIEIDPRKVSNEHLDTFIKNGITRVSLGIQDFDPVVQLAIHRTQSFELVEKLVKEIRARHFESLNFEVIYGLPKQSNDTITKTFELINKLKPDLIAFYSYAHIPDRLKNQRLIKNADLPSGKVKQDLYETGKALLLESGYADIGMDHFALPGNFLFQAKSTSGLDRNFMGYVDKKSNILLGLGPSAISNSSVSFIQNAKSVSEYEGKIKDGLLAISSGHTHNEKDLAVQKIILAVMCKDEIDLSDNSLIPHWNLIQDELKDLEADGLIEINTDSIKILQKGKKFIRNIAMVFDYHFREKLLTDKFSQTI